MKNLLASTAIAVVSASAVFADAHSKSPFAAAPQGEVLYTSDLVGARLYVSESTKGELETRGEWDDVGEIHDIVVGRNGAVDHVLVDIGGFLGIGEKRVAVSMDSLKFVSDGEGATEYFVVMEGSRAALENAPAFDRTAKAEKTGKTTQSAMAKPMADGGQTTETANARPVTDDNAEMDTAEAKPIAEETKGKQMASNETMTNPDQRATTEWQRPRYTPPMIERDGYETAQADDLTTEDVTGARVYDANDEWIGEVNSLIIAGDGQLREAIIDVGGFLGIGEKQVALNMEELTIKRGQGDLRIYLDATEAQLNEMPEWQG